MTFHSKKYDFLYTYQASYKIYQPCFGIYQPCFGFFEARKLKFEE